jgi:hypothetical protein
MGIFLSSFTRFYFLILNINCLMQVRALFSAKDTALDLSEYTAGVVCGDLLAEYLVILDYGSRKLALVDIHEVMET